MLTMIKIIGDYFIYFLPDFLYLEDILFLNYLSFLQGNMWFFPLLVHLRAILFYKAYRK